MWFYKFTCEWYNEGEVTPSTETGLVVGSDLSEVIKNIEEYFGDTIISIKLEPWDVENVFSISEDTMTLLEKELI